MLDSRDEKCHAIIHGATTAAGAVGAGLAQIPFADNIPITGIQVGMIISLGHIFDIDLTEGTAKGLIASFATSTVGRNIASVLVGWVPVIGNTIKAGTAGLLTESIGWAAVKHFENLEEEKEDSFKHGIEAEERAVKEEFQEILNGCKNRDYFKITMFTISWFLGNNATTSEELFNIFLDKSTRDRLNKSLYEIDYENPLKTIKECIVKLDIEDVNKIKESVEIIKKCNLNIEYKKEIYIFEIIKKRNEIESLISINIDDRENKILSILNISLPKFEDFSVVDSL